MKIKIERHVICGITWMWVNIDDIPRNSNDIPRNLEGEVLNSVIDAHKLSNKDIRNIFSARDKYLYDITDHNAFFNVLKKFPRKKYNS